MVVFWGWSSVIFPLLPFPFRAADLCANMDRSLGGSDCDGLFAVADLPTFLGGEIDEPFERFFLRFSSVVRWALGLVWLQDVGD